jgi:hypothetical protein
MARIELRDATIRLKDGLSGSGALNEPTPDILDTTVGVDSLVLNSADTEMIPVGARFTCVGAAADQVYTVTARTPASASPTTSVDFTPAWGTAPVDDAVLTFMPQQIEIKIGDGNLTYTEAKEYEYLLDRGSLDTVREGDEQPVDVSLDFVYEFVTSGTNEAITPVDALKRKNGAAEWVSAAADPCEPFALDMEVEHIPPCGGAQTEVTTLSDFRYESLEFNLGDATISTGGRCNITEADHSRQDQ